MYIVLFLDVKCSMNTIDNCYYSTDLSDGAGEGKYDG